MACQVHKFTTFELRVLRAAARNYLNVSSSVLNKTENSMASVR